ncbi:hypothetical protein SRABI118_03524 [Massilia sp. Bi118]|uniref:hypothetical protein n=1 Tax=Massilia sp. Bi118 TaxID=2822346 RepID=UPI001D545259|nr:hypothetical protein [Massilia sp. Bi118]CAH0272305.1 hypothetical protein SRABI118_03524 [Massilia sp. Bi118]
MKRLSLLGAALLACAPIHAADFSGNWSLDRTRSTNLPPYYSQVTTHRLSTAQDGKQLTVEVAIEGARPEPEQGRFVYRFDGTPTTAVTLVRTPEGRQEAPTTMKASMDGAGRLHVDIVREFGLTGGIVRGRSSEDWSLSPDGRTLTVRQARPNMVSNLVFVRM